MVKTRRRDYGTPIQPLAEVETADKVEIDREEVDLPLFTVDPSRGWGISSFRNMEDHGGGSMGRDRYSGRAEGMAFNDWKTIFRSWQRTMRQRNPLFNDWQAFEAIAKLLGV